MNDCGCKIDYPPGYNGIGSHGYIVHCPLHANAEKMRDALKKSSWTLDGLMRGVADLPDAAKELMGRTLGIVDAALKELD